MKNLEWNRRKDDYGNRNGKWKYLKTIELKAKDEFKFGKQSKHWMGAMTENHNICCQQ